MNQILKIQLFGLLLLMAANSYGQGDGISNNPSSEKSGSSNVATPQEESQGNHEAGVGDLPDAKFILEEEIKVEQVYSILAASTCKGCHSGGYLDLSVTPYISSNGTSEQNIMI